MSVPMAFDEMAVVVTGVGGGIGLSTARAFAAAGACVVGLDMKSPENAEASFRVVLGDVADEATWDELGSGLCPNGVDVIVNAAGVSGAPSPLHETTLQDWEHVVRVNQTGTFLGSRFAVQSMLTHGRGGSIVNVSSIWGALATAGSPGYHASKGAVAVLTRNIAVTYANAGIRANAVHPGLIDTPMSRVNVGEYNDAVIRATPMARIGTADEVAAATLFLSGPAASYITGQSLFVDGGFSAV